MAAMRPQCASHLTDSSSGSLCRHLHATCLGCTQPHQRCRSSSSGAGGSRSRRLAVECKKRPNSGAAGRGGGAQQQRAQQAAGKQQQQQQSVASSSAAPAPVGYSLSGAALQQLDFANIDKLEVRGNEVVLTMKEQREGDGPDDETDPAALATVRSQHKLAVLAVMNFC